MKLYTKYIINHHNNNLKLTGPAAAQRNKKMIVLLVIWQFLQQFGLCCANTEYLVVCTCVGARVILACRDPEKGNKAVAELIKSLGPSCNVSFMKLDLASLQSVWDFVDAFNESKLNIFLY